MVKRYLNNLNNCDALDIILKCMQNVPKMLIIFFTLSNQAATLAGMEMSSEEGKVCEAKRKLWKAVCKSLQMLQRMFGL